LHINTFTLTTFAGQNGTCDLARSGVLAASTTLLNPRAVCIHPDGSTIILQNSDDHSVLRVSSDGSVSNVTGHSSLMTRVSGIPPSEVSVGRAGGCMFDSQNRLLFTDETTGMVWRISA